MLRGHDVTERRDLLVELGETFVGKSGERAHAYLLDFGYKLRVIFLQV